MRTTDGAKGSYARECGRIFTDFLRLGCHSFGGPVAHIGYFQREFVERRRQLSDKGFAGLVALCHFLPGPSSSQLGMALGYQRAGIAGSLAAFAGFTLPSAILMLAAALWLMRWPESSWLAGVMHGLKVFAVAVVMDALWQMGQKLSRGLPRLAITLSVAALVLLWRSPWSQIVAIAAAALCGALWLRGRVPMPSSEVLARPGSGRLASLALILFGLLLLSALLGWGLVGGELFDSFYRAGALVFGGGHVVLPLLEQQPLVHQLPTEDFLFGYSLAQAVPGPMFTLATYLGTLLGIQDGAPVAGAVVATIAIFLPGWLLLLGVMPHWGALQSWRLAAAAIAGVGAAAVGLLLAALINPVWPAAIRGVEDLLSLAVFFVCLKWLRLPLWLLVPLAAAVGALRVLI
ncbi:chromate efflux transporter [Microbulbifer sp. TYP-18]|uniref:chromate efflux transporter n=1 Tax=Microbulbifer sp. TYP-18 TaxID=3230024 RepID=UPI0034C6A419